MNKLLTIIVPSCNMENYLPKCLGSLIVDDSDLLQKLDVIVVNDGSKDRTSEIAHGFEHNYPDVFRIIDKPNGHYGSCVNAALPIARGIYVKILDADDYFDSAVLAEYIAFIDRLRHSDGGYADAKMPDVVFSEYRFVDEAGVVGLNWNGRSLQLTKEGLFSLDSIPDIMPFCQHHALAYKTELVRGLGYRQTEGVCYTDSEWSSIPMSAVKTAVYFPKILYFYLMGREGQSMEAATWEKNIWMMERVAFNILAWVRRNSARKGIDVDVPYEYAYGMFRGVYKTCIFASYPKIQKLELRETDDRLARENHDIVQRLETEIYSRRLPYHYVRAWRNHSRVLRIGVSCCRAYSWICHFITHGKRI